MTNPLRTVDDYELFLYTLTEQFPAIQRSTVTLIRRGASLARVVGELYFAHDFRIVLRERLVYDRFPVAIDWYGYELWRGEEKLCWYDPQPHPNEPQLQSNHPHHKHIPPDLKHTRVPAPEMRFTRPNLPILIQEIGSLIQQLVDEMASKNS